MNMKKKSFGVKFESHEHPRWCIRDSSLCSEWQYLIIYV